MVTRTKRAATAAQPDLAALIAEQVAKALAAAAPKAAAPKAAKAAEPKAKAKEEWKFLDLEHGEVGDIAATLADGRKVVIRRRYSRTFVTLA